MTRKEAINLVGRMVACIIPKAPDQKLDVEITESLSDMITANQIVEKLNKAIQDDLITVRKSHRKVYATLDERAIAALYTAIDFEGDDVGSLTSIAQYKNKHVFVINTDL